jgi:FAD:protein FMN transferase
VGAWRQLIRRRWRSILSSIGAACAAGVVAADAGSLERFSYAEPHMGTTVSIELYAAGRARGDAAARAAFGRVRELDRRLSDYDGESELMRASRAAVGQPVHVSPDLFQVLSLAQAFSERTGGAFDVTAGALTRLWRRARRQGALPGDDEIAAAQAVSGYRRLRLDAASRSMQLETAGTRVDLGGIGKGYAADRALEAMRELGVTRALVAAGGDIAVGDAPPGTGGWTVAVASLDASTPAPAPADRLFLANAGVSTSGDAEQWVEIDGTRYSHILDPRTGRPLTGQRSVTVVAPDATTSDMLATTVCVLGREAGAELVERIDGASALIGIKQGAQARWTTTGRWR